MRPSLLLFLVCLLCSAGCTQPPDKPVTIAINPWPGYEALYLAETKGFFDKLGLNVKLVHLGSLSDVQQAYNNHHVDGMASTVIEAVQVNFLGGKPNKIILVNDYSNGGDMIIAPKSVENMSDLKGRKVGAELSSLGIFLLQRALKTHGLALDDVTLVNLEQGEGQQALLNDEIDAFVTYPPFSVKVLEDERFHTIFSSTEIPGEVIDVVSVAKPVLDKHPDLAGKIRQAWQMALDQIAEAPEESYRIMADRQGISAEEFKATLNDLILLDENDQRDLFKNPEKLENSIAEVCRTLLHVESITGDCNNLPKLVYQGNW